MIKRIGPKKSPTSTNDASNPYTGKKMLEKKMTTGAKSAVAKPTKKTTCKACGK